MKNKSLLGLLVFFVLGFIGYNYVINNLDELFAIKGDYYYKKNNLTKAQELYEKAFKLGNKDSKRRDIYVNSIINSPLTTEAQEKLVNFVENSRDDVAKLKAEYFLYDLKREIHRKYENNFIVNAVYNQKILRWNDFPIKYSFIDKENAPLYFIEEIENAFIEWEKVTEHQILFEENSLNSNIIIKFENKFPNASNGQKFVVAYTTPNLNIDKLKNMEIKFYLRAPNNKYFSRNQVYNTALHEIAHALGCMGHSDDKSDVLYLTKDAMTVIKDKRETLSEADINTIKLLYEIKPQITNSDEPKGKYIPYLVLGTGKEINNEKIEEAKLYIRKAPNLPSGYIDLAEGYVIAKDYIQAVKSLERALRLADNDEIRGMIYFNLAVTNFYLDNLEKARESLNKSIQIKSTEEKKYLLGEILIREGKISEAIEIYSSLQKQSPENIEYTIALANIYVLNREFLKARRVLKYYIENNRTEKNNPRLEPYGILTFGL